MFHFDLNSCFTFKTISYYNENNELKFDPPVYEQRYSAVLKILDHEYWRGKMKKIIDFGCSEMKLATLLKRIQTIEHILEVDIDEDLLKYNLQRVKPLLVDYIDRRKLPLRIDVYKGSVDTSANCLKNTDAVIAVELIEHLQPDVFDNVPYNIFGFIKSKIVIITTPNADFNVLFNLNLPNGFRHPDHKFEWSRKQFKDWCKNICIRFPNYDVSITGIGRGPPDARQYGHVSQLAVFIRKDIFGGTLIEDADISSLSISDKKEDEYKLLSSVEFPINEDTRDNDQKILDEAKYHINRYITQDDRYWKIENNCYEIPLPLIYSFTSNLCLNEEELKTVLLKNNYKIENNTIILKNENDDDNEYCFGDEFDRNYDDVEFDDDDDDDNDNMEKYSEFDEIWD